MHVLVLKLSDTTSSLTSSTYDSIRRDKLYETIIFFGIPNKLIRLIKVTMNDLIYQGKEELMMTDGFR